MKIALLKTRERKNENPLPALKKPIFPEKQLFFFKSLWLFFSKQQNVRVWSVCSERSAKRKFHSTCRGSSCSITWISQLSNSSQIVIKVFNSAFCHMNNSNYVTISTNPLFLPWNMATWLTVSKRLHTLAVERKEK